MSHITIEKKLRIFSLLQFLLYFSLSMRGTKFGHLVHVLVQVANGQRYLL